MFKSPRKFFEPLAIGAPAPYRELPVRVERMIHFVPPHLEKVRAKIGETIPKADVILGNLEDAIPADAKEAARKGFIEMGLAHDYGSTGLWTRVNCLNSPWLLDDASSSHGEVVTAPHESDGLPVSVTVACSSVNCKSLRAARSKRSASATNGSGAAVDLGRLVAAAASFPLVTFALRWRLGPVHASRL